MRRIVKPSLVVVTVAVGGAVFVVVFVPTMRMAMFMLIVMGMIVFVPVGVRMPMLVRMFMLAVLRVFGLMTMFVVMIMSVVVRLLAFVFVFTFVRHFLFSASVNFLVEYPAVVLACCFKVIPEDRLASRRFLRRRSARGDG